MPTPRAIANYSNYYFSLFETVLGGQDITLEFTSHAEAVRRRAHLYAFRTALYSNPEHAPAITLGAPNIQFHLHESTLTLTAKGRTHDTPIRPERPPTVS